ncbi:MAG: DUF3592 domain-containing protein [Pseudomonadota bacterium]
MNILAEHRIEQSVRLAAFLLIFIAGAVAVSVAVSDYRNARASVSWPKVDGVVLKGAREGIRYAYFEDGRMYKSSRVRHLTAFLTPRAAPQARSGDTIAVYVSPHDAGEAVLQRGGSPASFAAMIGMGAALVFLGGGGFARSLTPHVRPEDPAEAAPTTRDEVSDDDHAGNDVDTDDFHETSFDPGFDPARRYSAAE